MTMEKSNAITPTYPSLTQLNDFIKKTSNLQQEAYAIINSVKSLTITDESSQGDNDMEALYDFMYWGNYDNKINTLATMTDENWNFPGQTNNLILKNYLNHTTKKLEGENKIIITDKYCLLNTGLYTAYYEPIYVYAEKYKSPKCDWKFKNFLTPYELGELGITELPDRANYFNQPDLLIFDAKCGINVQYKHILEDNNNIDRLPDSIRESKNLQCIFAGAIDIMKKKVAANYKLAVPQYYNGNIQLLLPLCLVDPNIPDLALVVTKNKAGNAYQGHTCLTLEMAYNNARLIAKPETNWLMP